MAVVTSHFGQAFQYMVCLIFGFYVQLTHSGDKNQLMSGGGSNLSAALMSILSSEPESGPERYLPPELTGFWSYNDSTDLSKYEDFDHAKFLERPFQKVGSAIGKPAAILTFATDDSADSRASASASADQQLHQSASNSLPVFDNDMVTNITAQLGGTAFLHCRVRKLGERSVSWVRRRDWHILTSGVLTYTNDERFQVVHEDNSDDWNLQIKFVQKRDNGTYECQVATGSGTISHYFNLHVVVPSAYILGSGEYHIGEGSTISLVCIIENSPQPPQYVFWYHNDRMINYDTAGRGGVTVSTEPGPRKTHSRLVVNRATPADTGNYTCRASNTEQDTIHVFVSKEGDNTAAIQRQESAAPHSCKCQTLALLFSTIIILLALCR